MKLCNRLISLLLAVVIVCSMIPLPAHAATGTAISTKEQLNDVRNDLAGSYYLANDIVFTAEDFAEGGAFYNDGTGWTPIGTVDTPFTGTFDGNGFAIKGLQCVAPVDIKMYAGLFGALSGTVKNLGMEGGTITAAITTDSWTIYAGSIAAVVAGGTIENCYNKNTVNATFCNGSGYAGGIAGYSYGTGKVTGTYNAGAITAKDTGTSTYGTCYVGGITGYMASEDGNDTTFETQNCYNSGTVSCTGNVYSSYYVGGVNGAMYGDASGCYNVGNVNVGPVDYICLGGIAGSTWGKISGGYNTGTVSTQAEEYVAIGGIAGTVSYSSSSGRGAIVGCNNSGTVKINPTSTNESDGTFKLGGLAGVASGNVNDSYNVGTVLLQPDLSGCMDAYIYMGGIAGSCNYEGLNGGVLRCYNAGAVTVDGTLKNAIISNIGGVAGFSVGTVVANCFNAADVTMNMATTYVPSVYVGGVVGNNEIYTVGSTDLGELTNSYNAGGLNITVSNNKNTCIGGVAGDNNTPVSNCYHLDAVSTGIASGTTGGTTACTESQMAQQATFSGFDFTNVWTMAGNSSYLYPELKSVTMHPPKTVTGIQVSTSPKTTYYVGDTLNVSGGKVTVSYSDGSSQIVDMTADMITGFNGNSSGTQTLTVSYAGKTTTFTVTVNGVTLTSIAIYKNPTKTTYVLGETVYADGGEIIAYYNNGTSKVISMTGGEVSVYGVTATQPGSYRMDVYYQGKLAYYYVTFVAPSVTGIKVTTLPKTEYFAGDTMDVSGGKVTVYYNNSTTKVVDMTEAMVSGFSTSSTGSKTLTVTYEGKTATYNIQVNAVVITSIAVATMPAKTTYAVGETLDLTGGLLELTYNNGKTETIDLSLATATGFDSATTGEKTVTLTYQGKQTQMKVTVACGHSWVDADCDTPKTCSACGETEGEAKGHSWVAADCDTPKTCSVCGATEGEKLGHSWVDADCDTPKTCSVCFATEGAANGHSFGDWFTDTATGEERRDCGNCDHFETRQQPGAGNILPLTGDLAEETVVYIDGQPYPVKKENGSSYVELPSDQETLLVTYTYHVGDANDVHTQYPTGMKVYRVAKTDDAFTATHIPQLDNLLQYSGSSIRITGKKGIRMITSLTKANKSALTGSGLAGFKLLEYGTALCWATDLTDGKDLTLGQSYTRSNYAYKKGVADPVFANTGNLTQYTNVLVGFTDEQCKPDIVMRPYIILQDAAGKQVTLYGGSVHRSVGYIAYQNRNVFKSGSASYKYVWNIIHAVYGNTYDAEFKG